MTKEKDFPPPAEDEVNPPEDMDTDARSGVVEEPSDGPEPDPVTFTPAEPEPNEPAPEEG